MFHDSMSFVKSSTGQNTPTFTMLQGLSFSGKRAQCCVAIINIPTDVIINQFYYDMITPTCQALIGTSYSK